MVKNLVSKSEFARLCGVSPAAITKACNGPLAKTVTGKRVDLNHPDAVAYVTQKAEDHAPAPATGVDPLYEAAVEHCREAGTYTKAGLQRAIGVDYKRAAAILAIMGAAGLIPAKGEPPPEIRKPRTVRGHDAARVTKKDEALHELLDRGETVHEIPEDIQGFADMTLRELIQRYGTDTAFCDWLKAIKYIEEINKRRLDNAATEGKLVSRELVKVGIIEPIDSAHIKLLTDGSRTIARRLTAKHDAGEPLEVLEKFVAEQITSFIRPVKAKVARALRDA